MKNACVLTLALFATIAVGMPRNSFLVSPAPDKASFIAQATKSPVLERYTNFFLANKSDLSYAFERMYAKNLTQSHRVNVWRYTKRGYASNVQTLKKGTKVWMLDNSLGFLAECGNPLTKNLPKPPSLVLSPPAYSEPDVVEHIVLPIAPTLTSESITTPLVIMEPSTPQLLTMPITPEDTPLQPKKKNNLAPLVNLLGAAYTFGAFQHHSQPPVPEPSAFVGMIIGIGMLTRHRIKKGGK